MTIIHKPNTFKKQEPKIFDQLQLQNTGILFWQQQTLNNIAKLSGPLASTNEFQIHYWALVVRLKFSDKSIIDIGLPTTIYNYEQEVNPAHIDFELKDVNKMSEALKPIHNSVTNKLLPQLEKIFQSTSHYKVEYLSVPLNTMHRHPTGVASFSGTDLRKDHKSDTGIVFPLKTGDNTPSFSSIIYNNPVKLIHTEYRIATGDVTTKEGIHYQKGKCATYIQDEMSQPSMADLFLGHKPENKSYLVDRTNIADIQPMLQILDELNYKPNTQFIKADNLTKKVYTVARTTTFPTTKTDSKLQSSSILGTYDEETQKLVKEITKLNIKNINIVRSMTLPELRYNLLPLEKYYYADVSNLSVTDYVDLTKKELIEQIIEVQDLIIEEVNDIMETVTVNSKDDIQINTEEQRKMLISFGAPETDIKSADAATINRWYTELTLFDEVY